MPKSRSTRQQRAKRGGQAGSLSEYGRKRRFDETPEPKPGPPRRTAGSRFVVQKHDATRLHYDFRLEIDGVLKSWAVPKGPSLNPADKRLAMETEDHPLEYADFEGVIPEGHYGAGSVIVWDQGTFTPEGSTPPAKQLAGGELKFVLNGKKLRGGYALVRMRRNGKGKPWLLIKHRDEATDSDWDINAHGDSAISGRSLRQVEHGLPASSPRASGAPNEPEGARKTKMPASVSPMLATLVDQPFSDPDWLFEIKWDGVRSLAWIQNGRVELHSRTGRAITAQYPELKTLPSRIDAKTAILDGEIVTLDEKGISRFERLQSRINVREASLSLRERIPVTYCIFDLLYCDGYDLRNTPLLERKTKLKNLLRQDERFVYADHQREKGREFFAVAREHGLEGIVGKEIHSRYATTRSRDWVKCKITREVDVVIGGYTAPRGSRQYFGALLAGLYDGRALRFAGGVGTGFDQKMQKAIYEKLKTLGSGQCPFEPAPDTREKAQWIKPKLVARLKYANWTEDRRLRAPVFLALLDDHKPSDCQFKTETPIALSEALTESKSSGMMRHKEGKRGKQHDTPADGTLTDRKEIETRLLEGRDENLSLEIDGKPLRLTHLNKVYFPESGYTKRDLLAYYYKAAKYILPFLKDRPLVLKRYPDGISGKPFFQKDAGKAAQEWMETVTVHSEDEAKDIHYFVANDLAALLYLTNLGCIDHNPWSSRRDDLDHPDYLFFDLDPSDQTDFTVVVEIARAVYAKLMDLGMKVFLKTSGATGFHLYVPIDRNYTFDQVRTFADLIGQAVADENPKRVTRQRTISKRPPGTVMIDAYQNAPGRPLAPPYAVRAFPKAPVSTPILARELKRGLRPERFNLKSIFRRLDQYGDLWADFWSKRQRLEDAINKAGQKAR